MYTEYPPADHRTYRDAPSLATTLALAALPFAAMLVAAFPTVAVGLAVGLAVGRATTQ